MLSLTPNLYTYIVAIPAYIVAIPAYIVAIPEYVSFLILPLLMMATLLSAMLLRKKNHPSANRDFRIHR